MIYRGIKRRVFISHYKEDREEVDEFISKFSGLHKVFTPYVLGANGNDEFINSTNTEYVMKKIREKYLKDSTVTIVLLGSCTHSRRYVDWEIKSSLRQGGYTPNGLLGIALPSQGSKAFIPPRLDQNWNTDHEDCYARCCTYPNNYEDLGGWIDEAYEGRLYRKHLIINSQDMMKYNKKCLNCDYTH